MNEANTKVRRCAHVALMAGAAWGLIGGGVAAAQGASVPAKAGDAAQQDSGEIIVTGTLIRGIATPTGATLLNITRDSITSTGVTGAKDLLNQTVPQLSTFNALPTGSVDYGSAVSKISLRGIGTSAGLASGTNATLVLLNGHRVVPVGILSTDADPDLIPSDIIDSVQVLPDGGSATYGSDAIGGVVNFVTRKKFTGVQLHGQHVFGDKYHENTATGVVGKSWSTGTAYVSATYNQHNAILGKDRDYITTDFRSHGGNDNRSTACAYGNFTVNGQTYTGNGFAPVTSPDRCDATNYTSLTPNERRWNVFGYLEQEVTDNIKFSVDGFWADREADIYSDIGNIPLSYTITSASPYFHSVAGETSQTVSVDYARAIGNARVTQQGYTEYQISPNLTWKVNDNWQVRAEYLYGESTSTIHDRSGVNGGAITSTNFNPYDPSLTDPAVLRSLADYEVYSLGNNTIESGGLSANGTLFRLPGGDVKLAVGGEIRHQSLLDQTVTGSIGSSVGLMSFNSSRTVNALFAEVQVPVVGRDNAMPGLRALSLNAAVRYDHYSDFGGTTNPRVGFDYRPFDDLVIRANYQTTFVAPSLADSGNQVDTRLQIQTLNPNVYQIFIAGAGQNLKPETGRTYSIGAEWAPKGTGLSLSLTYWNTQVDNLISQALSAFGGSSGASLTAYNLCGTGYAPKSKAASANGACTAAYLNSIQNQWLRIDNGAAPGIHSIADLVAPGVTVADVIDARRKNFGSAKLDGIDFNLLYHTDVSFGSIFAQLAGTYNLNKDISSRPGGVFVDYIGGAVVVGSPRYNLVLGLGGSSGPVTLRTTVRCNGGYNIPAGNAPGQSHVSAYTLVDLFAGVDLGKFTALKNTKLDIAVNNLFDQDPPYYGGALNANRPAGYANGGTLGRTVAVGVTTKF